MTAPAYTTDLLDWIADSDTTPWGELVTAASGGSPDEADTESALQGTNSCSQSGNTTSLISMCRILASPVTLTTGQVFLVWHGHGVATNLLGYSSGGLRLAVANTLTDWKGWAVGGNDVPPFPYSKWVNNPIDPTVSYEYSNGTAPSTLTLYGVGSMAIQSAAILKGQPHIVDMIRYGRAEARIAYGATADGYATFAGFAAINDTTTNRWGLIQAVSGGYQWKGLMILGYVNAVDFRDSNKNIFIQDCRKVYAGFNKIEVKQAGSRVDWTNIGFTNVSLSTNASAGAFEMIDNADVNIESCSFTDMSTFVFQSNATVNASTFRRCGQVTVGGGIFTNCLFDQSSASSAVSAASPAQAALISNTDFVSDGTGYGITVTGTAANMTLTNVDFSNYAATDGTSGNEAIFFNIAAGSMNLTITGGTTPSIRTAGVAITLILSSRTVGVYTKTASGAVIGEANIYLAASGTSGPFPANESVTIVNSGTTATVTHTAHGIATNDYVCIKGASLDANNGVFQITKGTGEDTYTYTMGSTPGSSPTGTITSTFVFLKGLSNITTGYLDMSRSIPSAQEVTGWARKSSGSPYYKTGPISGTVSSSANTIFTAVLTSDE